jgi:hypothetical protein
MKTVTVMKIKGDPGSSPGMTEERQSAILYRHCGIALRGGSRIRALPTFGTGQDDEVERK